MRIRFVLVVALAWSASAAAAAAQSAMPDEGAKAVLGAWEMSNAERDRNCTVTLRSEASGTGRALQWDDTCAQAFPFTKDVTAWDVGDKDVLRLMNAQGRTILQLSEVEGGLYEGERPGEGLLFLQSAASEAADSGKTNSDMAGEWAFAGGDGKPICGVSLIDDKSDAPPVRLQPGCDARIADFAPATWQMDRGQLVVSSKEGDVWRFEEDEAGVWQRIPRAGDPLQLMRK